MGRRLVNSAICHWSFAKEVIIFSDGMQISVILCDSLLLIQFI